MIARGKQLVSSLCLSTVVQAGFLAWPGTSPAQNENNLLVGLFRTLEAGLSACWGRWARRVREASVGWLDAWSVLQGCVVLGSVPVAPGGHAVSGAASPRPV